MVIKVITPPEDEPLTLDEVKSQLNIVDTDKDALLQMYLTAATEAVDHLTNRVFVQRTLELILDSFPCSEIELPIGPVLSIVNVRYDDEDGVEQTVNSSDFYLDATSTPSWVLPNSDFSWPATLEAVNSVRVRYIAGYEPSSGPDPAGNVPNRAKLCILFLIGTWFENRESVSQETLQKVPDMLDALASQLKVYS